MSFLIETNIRSEVRKGAHVHNLTLVTRNAVDVAGLGVTVLNPFDP